MLQKLLSTFTVYIDDGIYSAIYAVAIPSYDISMWL